jgi:trigger factor
LTQQQVETANASPHNRRSGVSKPYDLHFGAQDCTIEVGSNVFTTAYAGYGTVMVPFVIDGVAVLGFILGDDHLLLNLVLFDEYNKLILQIQNNALIYSVAPWDIELVGKRLRVRERAKSFLLDVVFDPPSKIAVERARFMLNGVEILVRPDHVLVLNGGALIRGNRGKGFQFGFVLGTEDPPGACMVRLNNLNRYEGDRSEVLAWAKDSLGRYPSSQ